MVDQFIKNNKMEIKEFKNINHASLLCFRCGLNKSDYRFKYSDDICEGFYICSCAACLTEGEREIRREKNVAA